jgi:hypothetical protein
MFCRIVLLLFLCNTTSQLAILSSWFHLAQMGSQSPNLMTSYQEAISGYQSN